MITMMELQNNKESRIILKRHYLGDTYTIGKLYIDRKYICDTLEDKVRDLNKNGKFDNGEVKLYGRTAIPYGTYKLSIHNSPKFKRPLLMLNDVPEFSYILIHAGNFPEDTHGCILPGKNIIKGAVIQSKKYEKKINDMIMPLIRQGEEVYITII